MSDSQFPAVRILGPATGADALAARTKLTCSMLEAGALALFRARWHAPDEVVLHHLAPGTDGLRVRLRGYAPANTPEHAWITEWELRAEDRNPVRLRRNATRFALEFPCRPATLELDGFGTLAFGRAELSTCVFGNVTGDGPDRASVEFGCRIELNLAASDPAPDEPEAAPPDFSRVLALTAAQALEALRTGLAATELFPPEAVTVTGELYFAGPQVNLTLVSGPAPVDAQNRTFRCAVEFLSPGADAAGALSELQGRLVLADTAEDAPFRRLAVVSALTVKPVTGRAFPWSRAGFEVNVTL